MMWRCKGYGVEMASMVIVVVWNVPLLICLSCNEIYLCLHVKMM